MEPLLQSKIKEASIIEASFIATRQGSKSLAHALYIVGCGIEIITAFLVANYSNTMNYISIKSNQFIPFIN